MRDLARAWLPIAVVGGVLVSARAQAAEPDEKTQCISASDQGQQLRDDGKFNLAREAFTRCSRATCPAIVRQECAQWLVDVEAKSPTVVIDAADDKGNDLVDVKVTVDGVEATSKLDGLPMAVDGGEHVYRYEAAGFSPIEEHVVIHAGEKNRVLKVRFVPSAAPPSVAPPPPESASSRSGAPPIAAWVFTGVAVAAFASETYFGLTGIGQFDFDKGPGGCVGHCSSSEINSIKTEFAVADVSLGVGVVSACFAAYFFLRPRAATAAPATAVGFAPHAGGGVATWSGRF